VETQDAVDQEIQVAANMVTMAAVEEVPTVREVASRQQRRLITRPSI
jgi:hypothetical protein